MVFVYPNPTTGIFKILKSSDLVSEITLTDIYGKMIYRSIMENEVNLDISQYENGVYIVNIKGKNNVITRKIVKSY